MLLSKFVGYSLFLFAGALAYGDAVCSASVGTQVIGSAAITAASSQTGATSCEAQVTLSFVDNSSSSATGSVSVAGNTITLTGDVSLGGVANGLGFIGQSIAAQVSLNDNWAVYVPGSGTGFFTLQYSGLYSSEPQTSDIISSVFDSKGGVVSCQFNSCPPVVESAQITLGQYYLLSLQGGGYFSTSEVGLYYIQGGDTNINETIQFFAADGVTPIDPVVVLVPEPSSIWAIAAALIVLCSLGVWRKAKPGNNSVSSIRTRLELEGVVFLASLGL
jgi:hypothetical protein